MKTNEELKELIDWPLVLSKPRYAGGHDEVMQNIFGDRSKVIAHWNEGDYQGQVATAHQFSDGSIALFTDFYGSCSGCDSWEDSSEEDARKMINDLVTSCVIQPDINTAILYLKTLDAEKEPWKYSMKASVNLLEQLSQHNT